MLCSMRPLFADVPGVTDDKLLKMYSEIEPSSRRVLICPTAVSCRGRQRNRQAVGASGHRY